MAKNRTSKFGVEDGLFDSFTERKESSNAHTNAEVQIPKAEKGKGTRDRVNLLLTEENTRFIEEERRKRGASKTGLINRIIEEYRLERG